MKQISTVSELRRFIDDCYCLRKSIGFVPTMGYLHEGHLSLVQKAREENNIVVVSIYVNPTQFGPSEDFLNYPRDIKRDKSLLKKTGVDVLFTPTDQVMYGRGSNNLRRFLIKPPAYLLNCLCAKSRVGHFQGVALVVSKLFNMVRPHKAYFGQKDYQQAIIIKKLVADLSFNIEVIICPTVRAKDGLAMSSRNMYLRKEERKAAVVLYRALVRGEQKLEEVCRSVQREQSMQSVQGVQRVAEIMERCKEMIRRQRRVKLEYFEIREAETLREVSKLIPEQKLLLAGAIKVGKTRLIDNVVVD